MPQAQREKIILGWSGGKDSILALRNILREGRYEVAALVTTCTEGVERNNFYFADLIPS
ncbi:MAG: hypothetical protein PHD76_14255 [Methylacidiphilales bacterium]|nr:hypothetical protein [Candidatus Methylacidiphilales bacterium]